MSASGTAQVSGTGTRGVPQYPKPKGHPRWDAVLLCRDSLEGGQCPAVAAQGSWTGLPPRMPGMRSGCVLPAPLPPPTPRTGYSLSREAQVQPPYGKTSGHVLGTAPALGWDPVRGNLGLWHRRAGRRGSVRVQQGAEDLLRAKCRTCINSRNLTATLGEAVFQIRKLRLRGAQELARAPQLASGKARLDPGQPDAVVFAVSHEARWPQCCWGRSPGAPSLALPRLGGVLQKAAPSCWQPVCFAVGRGSVWRFVWKVGSRPLPGCSPRIPAPVNPRV